MNLFSFGHKIYIKKEQDRFTGLSRLINYDADPWCIADQIVLKKRRRVFTLLLVSYKPALKVTGCIQLKISRGETADRARQETS